MDYLLYNPTERLYWSDEDGWVDPDSATRYKMVELQEMSHYPGLGTLVVDENHTKGWIDPLD